MQCKDPFSEVFFLYIEKKTIKFIIQILYLSPNAVRNPKASETVFMSEETKSK